MRTNPMDAWISRTLRAGVLVAAAIIAAGVVLYVTRGAGPDTPHSLHALLDGGGHPSATSPAAIGRGLGRLDASAVIEAGIIALILTPVVRVALTLLLFLIERDRIFAGITAVVFVVLVAGLIGIGA